MSLQIDINTHVFLGIFNEIFFLKNIKNPLRFKKFLYLCTANFLPHRASNKQPAQFFQPLARRNNL